MCKINYPILLIVFFFFCYGFGQERDEFLTLKEVLKIASHSTLDALKAKQIYNANYWEYRSFEAQLFPHVSLELQPFTYNRSFIKRYDQDNNIDVFRLQENLNTFSEVSITQNIMATGAKVYLSSTMNRLVNYSDVKVIDYNVTPIRIGIYQPLMAFNDLKWQHKTSDLEYQKAKKEYIYQQQEIKLKTLSYFFEWVMAYTKVEMIKENKMNSERLYEIGKKRYDLGSIEKDELLNLELQAITSKTGLNKALQELNEIVSDFNLFLGEVDISKFKPELPVMIKKLRIEKSKAEHYAKENNPELLNIAIREINAARDLDQVIKENRFDLALNLSYGLNQQADNIEDAYSNFLDEQIVAIQLKMPLLDWGERKGRIKMAKNQLEVEEIQIQQDEIDIKRELKLALNNFNMQEEQVLVALRAKEISHESYEITEKRFLSGKVDYLRLNSAREAWQGATEQYIQQIASYWTSYYNVQKMTLYDFINESNLVNQPDLMEK
ncbi:TolC family protein [Joostella atrarenae]|uniref:TolC family protein n=1 Tax=Joostella atrarenae TaxID=679257 RepID=A0ABS9J7C9_9FLAO|nr:TolC family protein [Joostella atrarenae]MCF8716341.1 TolC family protein [Joostella atrarenae]